MAATTLTGTGIWVPDFPAAGAQINQSQNVTVDAANEACQFIGYVALEGRTGSKTISAAGGGIIHWSTGVTATFANGSTNLRIGIQDVTTGVPARGDGTFDVYADLVGGTDTISSNAWMSTAMETGTKDITHGQLVCVALTMTARGGADSIHVRNSLQAVQTTTTFASHFPQVVAVTSGPTYTSQAGVPICLIEFDDGTYGFIDGGVVLTPTGNTTLYTLTAINTGTTPDEYALIFQLPFPATVDALSCVVTPSTTAADLELILYSDPEGTPAAIETLAIDANQVAQAATARNVVVPLATPRDLSANTKYAVALRPTTATDVSAATCGVDDAAHWKAHTLGTSAYLGTRSDQTGAFATTTTLRMYAAVRISKLDNGTGGGGQRIFGG
jgi:hypothetical protein